MTNFEQDYKSYIKQHGEPERIELLLCDINAVLRGKWLPGDQWQKLRDGKVRLPMSTYAPAIMGNEVEETGLGIVVGDPDGKLVPIAGTLKPVPWAEGGADSNVAQVEVELADLITSEISPYSTRKILENQLQTLKQKGLTPVVATELEFYLIAPRTDRSDAPYPLSHTPDMQNYDLESMDKCELVLNDIRDASKIQNLATDTLIAEYGPGQFEINFHHTDDALEAASTALLFKRIVRACARKHGCEATFMAKPYADHPGNGMHVHASVLDQAGNNIFARSADTSAPNHILQNAISGLLHTMADFQIIFAPHMNSYRRFQPNSFAPTTPDWGLDNRAASIRIPEASGPAARFEHRLCGADTNPYLVIAAILYGLQYGPQNELEHKPKLKPSIDDMDGKLSAPLEHDWQTALKTFETSGHSKSLLGDLHPVFSAIKQAEIEAIATQISAVEYKYYLSRF